MSNITIGGSGGGGATGATGPAGADTNVQYNDGGAFGGDSSFDWNKTAKTLVINGAGPLPLTPSSAPGQGMLTLSRIEGVSPPDNHYPDILITSDTTGGIWNRFLDEFENVNWQFGTSQINGAGSGNAFWFFQETTDPAFVNVDTGRTVLAMWNNQIAGYSFLGTNAKGVFNWSSDPAYAGLPGGASGGPIDLGLSRVGAKTLGVGDGSVPGAVNAWIAAAGAQFNVDTSGAHSAEIAEVIYTNTSTYFLSMYVNPVSANNALDGIEFFNRRTGTDFFTAQDNGLAFTSVGVLSWNSNATDSWRTVLTDTGVSKVAPAVVGIGNGTQGDTSGTLELANITAPGNLLTFRSSQYVFDNGIGGPTLDLNVTFGGDTWTYLTNLAFKSQMLFVSFGGAFCTLQELDNPSTLLAQNAREMEFMDGPGGGATMLAVGDTANFSNSLVINSYTVAALPPAPVAGQLATVNNALAPVVGAAVVGGGAAFAMVCFNGAAWKVFVI